MPKNADLKNNDDSHAIIPSHPFPFSIHHFYTSHNAPYLPPKVLHNLYYCSRPKRNENNAYAKSWGANKVHYGKCGSGVCLKMQT